MKILDEKWRLEIRLEAFITDDEREMLIRYCIRFTHDWSLAEDLVQQTLLEAWLKSDQVYTEEVRLSWLFGIARNICLRWARRQSQEPNHLVNMDDVSLEVEDSLPSTDDLQRDWERHELAQFVEKALALLPSQARTILVPYYLESIPQASIAQQLGISVGAVEARLHRGKQALRHLITHELREEAISLGLITAEAGDWQHTRIWCLFCGEHQLLMRLPQPPGTLSFRCPGCSTAPQEFGWGYKLSNERFIHYLADLRQPKAIFQRFTSWAYEYYATAASHYGHVACAQCGQPSRLQFALPACLSQASSCDGQRYGLSGQCPSCGWQNYCSPCGLLQGLPAVQQFWRDNPRMHLVFREPLAEVAGRSAWVASFESMNSNACLDIVLARETLQLLKVQGYTR